MRASLPIEVYHLDYLWSRLWWNSKPIKGFVFVRKQDAYRHSFVLVDSVMECREVVVISHVGKMWR